MRSVLLWVQRPPYSTNHLAESIRAYAMSSALGLLAQLLFTGEGVWALVKDQEGYRFGPPPETVLRGLLNEKTPAIVSIASLAARSISRDRLAGSLPLHFADDDEIAELLLRADTVVSM